MTTKTSVLFQNALTVNVSILQQGEASMKIPTIDNQIIKIPLTQKQVALINMEDYQLVNQFKWYAHRDWNHGSSTFYAKTNIRKDGKIIICSMHRLIMNAQKEQKIDHKDMNGLNNCRNNLRFANMSQNRANTRKKRGNMSSQYKGVFWSKKDKKWIAKIKGISIGYFINEQEAAFAYDNKAKKIFREFARTNF